MADVLAYIEEQKDKTREILLFIHDLMLSYEGVSSKVRYKIPFYYKKSWIAYANPLKTGGVELVFLRANEFNDPTGLLDFKDRKQVAGLTIHELEDIPDSLTSVLEIALDHDLRVKYKSKRSK